jgi:Fe2+ transport system protein B
MKIDNRILLPFVAPFALLCVARLMWLVAGLQWQSPERVVMVALVLGWIFGLVAAMVAFINGTSLGHITIGKREGGE